MRAWSWCSCALLLAGLTGCGDEAAGDDPRPRLLVTAERRAELGERLTREPYASIHEIIRRRAARPVEAPDPMVWDHGVIGRNNETAQANALLAWLHDDPAAADKAKSILLSMPTDFETNLTWDVNIRMPHVLMPYCYAWDLLRGTPYLSDDEAEQARARITSVTQQFFARYVDNPVTRQAVLGFSQNNHPIRTAAAIGLVALTFPDHPDAPAWESWAVSELSYLFGPEGRYVQADGGVSEGPFYYGFAFGPAVAMFIAMDNAIDPGRTFVRDCRNRQKVEPWNVTDCRQGEPFSFANPLYDERFHATVDWSIDLRLPIGWRAPLADANFISHNGSPLLTSYGGAPHTRWDFDTSPEDDVERLMTWGMDLSAHHLAYLDDAVEPEEPPWTNRFLPAAGNAVFRSGWDADARWLLLVAEHGPARMTLHDHVDGTSFSLAAYGEYLLLDPGYYKPDNLDNALTADSNSHNVIRIDGYGAPDKGLLVDFGDADAFLENTVDGQMLAYAEAHQSYQSTAIERSVVFVRQRYFVVADRLETTAASPRTHTWRLGGWAGKDVPGTFALFDCQTACGARWERTRAGVDVLLAATAPGLLVGEPPHEPLTAPHVGAFDEQRTVADHGVMDGTVEALAPGFLAVLAPYRVGDTGDDGPLAVTPIDAGDEASAWLIRGATASEVAWLRKAGAATTLSLPNGATFETDAELLVADTGGAFALIARGSSARLDGSVLVSAGGAPVAKAE